MNILIFGGSGKIGAAVAWNLVKANDVDTVGIIGRHEETLERTRTWINSPKIRTYMLDITDIQAVKSLMQRSGAFCGIEIYKDYAGVERVVKGECNK